mgnify:CR=1 FL=1
MLSIPYRWFFYFYIEQAEVREETFFESTLPGALKAKGGISMSLMELFTLLTVILMLLSLILDAVRLTVEVLEKFSQRKCDDNKKD